MIVTSVLILSDPQNFLGAAWAPWLLQRTPRRYRKAVGLKLLSLSPHYFSGNVEKEAERNRITREQIALDVIAPLVKPTYCVLDYGCGAGYMARAVSRLVHHVDAVDISDGVLACAEALNDEDNIRYLNVRSSGFQSISMGTYDLAYSFAVAQHLTDDGLAKLLGDVKGRLKGGGLLLLHVVIDAPDWRTEEEWRNDTTLHGRIRFRYGLHCFTRTAEQICAQVRVAGFRSVTIEPLSTKTTVEDDVARQHLATVVSP
jgi:cyclopropane fatty-acyl-phospholipid synthase-like methyltransferase